jgi:negative regulator of sigma E activity
MNKKTLILTVVMILTLSFLAVAANLTADQIIEKRDENEYLQTAYSESKMIIYNQGREITKTMQGWQEGDNGLAEFTNPRDRGTKYLKRDDDLWMFFPEAEEVVKNSGHMLEQGMMGSDFSYEDLLESDKLTELYDFELLAEEEIDGRQAYKLEGVKVEGKDVAYYRRVVWIDQERFVTLKEEYYTESGRLLKISQTQEVEQIEGRWYPVRSTMENQLRKNSSTEFIMEKLELNPEIPEDLFSIERLR